jgi:uncharacterized membrane protein YkvA (DUF1232 family)
MLINTTTLKRTVRSGVKKIKKTDLAKVIRNSRLIHTLIRGPLAEVGEDAATLLAMIKDFSKGHYREVPRTTLVSAAFALLYALNPLDLMPDFLPGIGYLDDVSIFMMVVNSITNDLENYRVWSRERRSLTKRIKTTVAGLKKKALTARPDTAAAT